MYLGTYCTVMFVRLFIGVVVKPAEQQGTGGRDDNGGRSGGKTRDGNSLMACITSIRWVLNCFANSQAAFRGGKCMTQRQSQRPHPCYILGISLLAPLQATLRIGLARLLHGSCKKWPPTPACWLRASRIDHRPSTDQQPQHFPSPATPLSLLHPFHPASTLL
jgi:hypothetical protein